MSGLDGLLRALPSFYAQAKAGEQAGFDRRRQQLQENEDRQRAAEQAALQQMLLQSRMREDEATAPYRRQLLKAQADDETARATGTGQYAPRPEKPTRPNYQKIVGPNGDVTFYDPETNQRVQPGLRERVPAGRSSSDPTPNRANYVARRAILLLKERDTSNPYASTPKYRTLAEAKQAAADEYDTLYGEGDGPGTPTSPPPIRDFFGAVGTAQSGTKPPTTEPDEDADPDFAELERQYQANKRKP